MGNGEASGSVRADKILASLLSERQFCHFTTSQVRADNVRDNTGRSDSCHKGFKLPLNIHLVLSDWDLASISYNSMCSRNLKGFNRFYRFNRSCIQNKTICSIMWLRYEDT